MTRRSALIAAAATLLAATFPAAARQPTIPFPIVGFPQETEVRAPEQVPDTRHHDGAVISLARRGADSPELFAGTADGFVVLAQESGETESWQISELPVRKIAIHPNGNLVAAYESDGFSVHRLSVWDWKNKSRLYAKRFRDSVISVSWSARGTYLLVGNTSVEGITVFDGDSGKPKSVFKSSPGIVSLSLTGGTETSMITFGPSGTIRYTDVSSGTERARYDSLPDVASPTLLNNNLRIAGRLGDEIVTIDATSGKRVASYASPGKYFLATAAGDTVPVWLSASGDGWTVRQGDETSARFSVPDGSAIASAIGLPDRLAFGTDSGMIYTVDRAAISAKFSPKALGGARGPRIDDVTTDGSRLFILSEGTLLEATGPDSVPAYRFNGLPCDRIAANGDGSFLAWSAKKAGPILLVSADGASKTVLYQAKEGIRSLSAKDGTIAFIEGTSMAVAIGPEPKAKPFTYTGAGLQDALPLSADRILITKSTTMRSPSPILLISTETGETVPLPVEAELCYGLRQTEGATPGFVGFLVKNGDAPSTEIVTFAIDGGAIATGGATTKAAYQDEDLTASLSVKGSLIYTNLGKGQLSCIDSEGNRQSRMDRGYSLPAKTAVMENYVATLNANGSITWFQARTNKLIGDAALGGRGVWLVSE
jgi:hypothetical protein